MVVFIEEDDGEDMFVTLVNGLWYHVKTDTLFLVKTDILFLPAQYDAGATACIYINKCNLQIDEIEYTLKIRLLSHY